MRWDRVGLFLRDATILFSLGAVMVIVVGVLGGGMVICPANEPFASACQQRAQSAVSERMLYAALPWLAALIVSAIKRFSRR